MKRYMVHLLVPPSERQPTDWEMDLKALHQAEEGFRSIVDTEDERVVGEVAMPNRPSVWYDIRRVADTGCMVYVSISDPPNPKPRQVAVTALFGGYEPDDEEVIEIASRALWQINSHVFDAPSLERAAKATRPLQLSSFRSMEDYEDDLVRIVIAAITQTFFDRWGLNDVNPEEPPGDPDLHIV